MVINSIKLEHGMTIKVDVYNDVIISDKKGNVIYWENLDGYWVKKEYDKNNDLTYYENLDGYWCKKEFNDNGNEIYFEDSNGFIIDNRPKIITIDDKEIALSKESYESLKKHFKEEK